MANSPVPMAKLPTASDSSINRNRDLLIGADEEVDIRKGTHPQTVPFERGCVCWQGQIKMEFGTEKSAATRYVCRALLQGEKYTLIL